MSLTFPDAFANLQHAVSISSEGTAFEFGVFSGRTLSLIREHHRGPVFGFDSFKGLPETWRSGFEKGHFATKDIPVVEGATIVVGLFNKTVPKTLKALEYPITLVHFDADLYSSTAYALKQVTKHLADRCVFVFDEYSNYPGWENHEYRAFMEWQSANPDFEVTQISSVPSHEQATFEVSRKTPTE